MAVGDALGVPFEFLSREQMHIKPATNMVGFGTHNQPAGTWSDDTSMALCIIDELNNSAGYNLTSLSKRFVRWLYNGENTVNGYVFDFGLSTKAAIDKIKKGIDPIQCGGNIFESNGNGSVMRILPMVSYVKDMNINQRFNHIFEASAITHNHFIAKFSCFILIEFALSLISYKQLLINEKSIEKALINMQDKINTFIVENSLNDESLFLFNKILNKNFLQIPINSIKSNGFAISTLEASIYCLGNTKSYAEAVLLAVNLGNDTDTNACVTGGLAGLLYGYDSIPKNWLEVLRNKELLYNKCN